MSPIVSSSVYWALPRRFGFTGCWWCTPVNKTDQSLAINHHEGYILVRRDSKETKESSSKSPHTPARLWQALSEGRAGGDAAHLLCHLPSRGNPSPPCPSEPHWPGLKLSTYLIKLSGSVFSRHEHFLNGGLPYRLGYGAVHCLSFTKGWTTLDISSISWSVATLSCSSLSSLSQGFHLSCPK